MHLPGLARPGLRTLPHRVFVLQRKARLILRALDCDEKWAQQEREQATARQLMEQRTLVLLLTEDPSLREPGYTPVQRQNGGQSYFLEEWEGDLPLTATAAAVTFGTAEYLERDAEVTREVEDWRERAGAVADTLARRRKARERAELRAEQSSWSSQVLSKFKLSLFCAHRKVLDTV